LSIKLAQHFNTEILSADSRQFFEEMKIGTAVPSSEELNAVKHHFIHHKSIDEIYNVGAFEIDAIECLNELFKHHSVVIMVGGSGLYVDAVTKGLDNLPDIDPSIRENLNLQLKNEGLESLQDELKKQDPESYKSIEIENPHRVIRALEVCRGSGKPFSTFLNKKKPKRNFKTISIGLIAEREIIYTRINQRVDIMMNSGLLEEVKTLSSKQQLNALNTVGYKELFQYLNNNWSLDFAISEIKKNTRRFAKRQLTWFRKNPSIYWYDYKYDLNNIIKKLEDLITE
jgi:tRNA dimethylallyltransferase